MTLKDIQDVSLEIMKDIHEFCVANDIHYSLAYGTLLGAVRHKGFIPWDDDADIIMPRPDFERFFKLYAERGKYKAAHPTQSYLAFGRVYDTEKTLVKSDVPWKKGESGIWVDIFPIDSVSDDREEFTRYFKEIRHLSRQQIRRRKVKRPFWRLRFKKKMQYIRAKFGKSLEKVQREYIHKLSLLNYGSTKHCAQLTAPDNINEYFDREIMEHYTGIEFEGNTFNAVKDYDALLQLCYGDYMQLPPVEDRVPKQISYIKFYWKDKQKS